jgi:hypothetical protein
VRWLVVNKGSFQKKKAESRNRHQIHNHHIWGGRYGAGTAGAAAG